MFFLSFTPAVKVLLLTNVGVLLLGMFLSPVDFSHSFGLHYVSSAYFQPYQFFTYMFVHAGGWHLFSNMLALIVFGSHLERFLGNKKFLLLYLITGIGAGVLYSLINFAEIQQLSKEVSEYTQEPDPESFNRFMIEHAPHLHQRLVHTEFIDNYAEDPNQVYYIRESIDITQGILSEYENIPMVGASGAVFGILMAFGMLFPNTQLFLLFPPIPIKAKYVILFYGLYEIYAEIQRMPGDNIAHLAHLSGMLIAFLLIRHWRNQDLRN
ncbi:MAG: rhomboid family intramembrane serine protease [Cytophagales bacterium]|nr:rhomboid family intramembrane serine protease [Cytophagales bacterium]